MAPLDVTLTAEVEQPDGSLAPVKLADLQQSDPAAGPGALEATQEAVRASVDALLAHLSAVGGTEVHGTVNVGNFPATYNVSDRPARQLGEVSVSNLPAVQEVEGTVDVAGVVDVGNFPADVDVRDRALRQLGHVHVDNQLDLTALATGARQDAQTALLTTLAGVDYATGADVDQVVARLDAIATNTADIKLDADHLSIEADAINLNTDGVEARLDTLNGKDFATQATLVQVLARANLLASEQTLAAISAQLPTALSGDGGLLSHVTNFPAVFHVDDNGGSLTVDGPLTDVQLRATPVPVAQSGMVTVDSELPAAAALSDALDRASVVPIVGAAGLLDNGVNLVRMRGAGSSSAERSSLGHVAMVPYIMGAGTGNVAPVVGAGDGLTVTGVAAAGNEVYNGASWDRMRSAAAATGTTGTGVQGVSPMVKGVANYNPLAAAVALGDGDTGVTALATHASLWNGATYDRTRSIPTLSYGAAGNTTGVGIAGVAALMIDNGSLGLVAPGNARIADTHSGSNLPAAGLYGWNSASWDRWRANWTGTFLSSAARTTTTTSAAVVNYNGSYLQVILDVTVASGTGGLQVKIEGRDAAASAKWFQLNATPTAVTATGTYVYEIGPGASGAASGGVVQRTAGMVPRDVRVTVTHGDGSSYTYTVGLVLGVG